MTQEVSVPIVPKHPGITGAGVSSALSHKDASGRCSSSGMKQPSAPQLIRITAGSQAWFCLTHLVLHTHPGCSKSKRTQPLSPTKFLTFLHSRQLFLMKVELLQLLKVKPVPFCTSFAPCPSLFSNPRNPREKQPGLHLLGPPPPTLLCAMPSAASASV